MLHVYQPTGDWSSNPDISRCKVLSAAIESHQNVIDNNCQRLWDCATWLHTGNVGRVLASRNWYSGDSRKRVVYLH